MKNKLAENMRRFGTKNLTEAATYTTKRGSKLEFRKVAGKGKQNQVDVINHNSGKTHRYALWLKGWTGTYAVNFKTISAVGNGLRIDRYVEGGTDPYTVENSDMKKIDWAIAQGKPVKHSKFGVEIYFKPV